MASYNPIIRQVYNVVVYVDSWQTSAKPLGQQTVEKPGKVRLPFLRARHVLLGKRHGKWRFSLRLSSCAFSLSTSLRHLKKYVCFIERFYTYLFKYQVANKRLSKEKQALVLAALCEGTPIRAAARMFKVGKNGSMSGRMEAD